MFALGKVSIYVCNVDAARRDARLPARLNEGSELGAMPGETRARFAARMAKVQAYMNSNEFRARDGGGLASLAQALRERCARVSELKGERLRT